MLKNLSQYLQEFIMKRTDEVGSTVLMKHREYREISEALQTILHDILKCVPEEQRKLVMEYEEKEHAQSALSVEIMYRQGLVDGFYLSRRFSDRTNI